MGKMHDQTNLSNNRPRKTKVVNNKEPSFHILEYGLKFSLFNNIGWEVEAPMP